MKLNTLCYAFVSFTFLSVSCSENLDEKSTENPVTEVLVADPLHGLRAVNLNEHELDIQIYIPAINSLFFCRSTHGICFK